MDEDYLVMIGACLTNMGFYIYYRLCKEDLEMIRNVCLFYQRNLRKALVALFK